MAVMLAFARLLCLLWLAIAALACGTMNDRSETGTHISLPLDGMWLFRTDPDGNGTDREWYAPDAPREGWDSVRVPGLWDGRGLEHYDGDGWYVRSFDIDLDTTHRHAVIFDGVDDNAEVWLNGVHLGTHIGYSEPFFFDVSEAIRARGNVLVVRVEDTGGPGGLLSSVRVRSYDEPEDLLRSAYHDSASVASPGWVRDAVVYEVYLRSFSPQGTFTALQQRLPELRALGVTTLWLMPIHPTGRLRRKGSLGSPYSVRDYYAVDAAYGTLDDFRALVSAVHAAGMHIIIDVVVNHTAWDNPLITQHPGWYTHDRTGKIISPNPDWSDVADLNYDVPALRTWMTGMMLYWVRDIGVDGFRCDVAEMVPVDFWVEAARELRRVKPVFLLAEGKSPALHVNAFDMTYGWNTYDILRPMCEGRMRTSGIDDVLHAEELLYPVGALRLRFSTNHDKHVSDGPAVARLGVDGAKAAAVLMHTLPGVPLIYNGQEIGSRTPMSLFERQPIDWRDDPGAFRALYTELNALRAAHPALRRGSYTHHHVDTVPSLFIFTRKTAGDEVLIIINCGAQPQHTSVKRADLRGFARAIGTSVLDERADNIVIDAPAHGYWIGVR